MAALDTAGWDQATLDYYNQLQAYRQGMEAKGFNVYDPNLVYGSFSPTSGFFENYLVDPSLGISVLPSEFMQGENEAYYKSLIGKDPASVYQSVLEFGDDPKFGSLGRVIADPNAQYRLVDVSGGNKVIYSGTGTDALQAIHALTPEYSKDATSQWRIESLGSGSKDWQSTPAFKPDQSSGFGKWLLGALPMVLIPGFGGAVGRALGVTGQLAAPVGAAAITGATGALAGKSFGDVLLGAGLAGLGTYAGGKLMGGGSSDGGGGGGGSGAGGGLDAFDGITVTGIPTSVGSSLGSVGALSSLQTDTATQRAIDQYAGQTSPTFEQQFDATFGTPSTGGGLDAITVTGNPLAGGASGVGGAIGSTVGALTSATNVQQQTDTQQPSPDEIVVRGNVNPPPSVIPGLSTLNVDTSIPPVTQQFTNADTTPDEIRVEARNEPQPTFAVTSPVTTTTSAPEATSTDEIRVEARNEPTVTPVPVPTTTTTSAPETPPKEDIVVTADKKPVTPPPPTTFGVSPETQAAIDKAAEGTTDTAAKDAAKQPSTLDEVIRYLQIGGLGIGLLGDLLGGGGKNTTTGTIPAGLFGTGTGTSIFTKPLPTANLPGLGTTGIGARTAADLTATTGLPTPGTGESNIDWYRYGYGPEQSFFKQVPQGAKNLSRAYTGYETPFRGLQNMAEGGYAVGGPGDGRDDKIPAMLSDGEYVMDAETVAMLGNGSSKAGADALDRFRVNIRKHKGRSMARGNFSVKAKKPEKYLKKDRA